jgi:NTE family protein
MKRAKIGLALGAGAARGLAHLGVLRVLERRRIAVDFLAGSSMGALLGCLYACGLGPDFMIKFANQLKATSWVDLGLPKRGFISGNKVEALLRLLTRDRSFADLETPFAAVATDIERGERVVLRQGKLAPAVRASCSIPVVFKPVPLGGRLLVDGGLVDQVPVQVVKEMGADFCLAVDVNRQGGYQPVNNIIDVMFQTLEIMEKKNLGASLQKADVLIRPQVGHIGLTHFQRVDELVALGEAAAEEALAQFPACLEAAGR